MLIYNKYKISISSFKSVLVTCLAMIMLSAMDANAQLTNIQSSFFQNPYLVNPAMAGMENALNLNMDYHQQWLGVPGSPRLTTFTADYNSGNKVGLGLNIYNDQAGLINRTRVMGTYAYHITLNEQGDKVNFGLSLGLNDAYINYSSIVGDPGDVNIPEFNKHGLYADGDLGVSYTSTKFNAQIAIPNLKRVLFKSADDDVDVEASTFYAAISYKIALSNDFNYSVFTIEPKMVYRGIQGYNNILDAGFNLYRDTFEDTYRLNVTGIYHSDNSATFGAGFDIHNFGLLVSYTYNTGPLSTYANNTFELGINVKLKKKTL
ncbi:MAG TPA: PorP/SprF family type IX secretion system membrane protein [Mucilaginibacter sp.]